MPVTITHGNKNCYHVFMNEPVHTRGCVYQTAYHMVWRPVYRRDVLKSPVKEPLENLLHAIANQHGMDVLAVDVQPDHVHLFVSMPPTLSIANAVKLFKGISARQLRLMYPALRKRTRADRLWAPSYYAGTAGHVSAETIRRYIESQEQHHAE
jgi:REP-associated tyrosine transposase